jgi:hypothetical protein
MLYAGALDAAWWTALGAPTRWAPDYSGISHSETYTPAVSAGSANWLMIGISLGTDTVMFQAPFLTAETDGGEQTSDNNFDTGFFWITADAGPDRHAVQVAIPGMPNTIGIGTGVMSQCVALEPYLNNGEVRPMSSDTPLNSAYYKTGFLYDVGSNGSLPYSDTVSFFKCPARGSTAQVNHYSPHAWAGTPPAVVAAIMLQMGQAAGYVDTAAFADAHDALRDDTLGEVPIDGAADVVEVYWTPTVYCSRKVGQRVIDLILEVIRHGRDMYFTREDGTISVTKFTEVTAAVSSLTLDDGVLDVEYSLDSALVFNTVSASWGSGYRQWGVPSDVPSATGFAVQHEPELDSFQDTKYVHEVSDATSVAKYGEIRLKGQDRTTAGSAGKKVETAHYPFFLGPGCATSWWETYGYGGMMHVTNWLKSDSQERRIVTLRQDMRALDWGIGSRVTGVAVTDDAATIAEAFCIERTYDFDRLTVESVLLERPSNV